MIEDYAKHAAVWDWDGYDNSAEYDYWCHFAEQYGKKVLIPMCALGQAGAYMAEKGFNVTAFDITEKMIEEGKKRFGSVKNLTLRVADICDFNFNENEFDFAFIATQDLHLLTNINMVKRAFISIAEHLRKGGCLALELILPSSESYQCPTQTFYPRVPNYSDKTVWKEGGSRYDAAAKKHYIEQVVYIKDHKGTESFHYSVTLQYFDRNLILDALSCAGYAIVGEYGNRNKEPWVSENREWFIEAVKR